MKEKTIKAIKVEPNKRPCVIDLNTALDSLQKAVSIGAPEQGLIEFVYLEDNVSILCNEEGKLIGLEPNRRLGNDILCGVFYVVAENEDGELMSLTPAQKVHYTQMFWDPDVIGNDEVSRTIFMRFIGG
jgi:hypothetical protein